MRAPRGAPRLVHVGALPGAPDVPREERRAMSQRLQKVQNLARQVLGEAMGSLKDPRIGFATVTAVRMSTDLRHARVLVSVLGSEEDCRRTMAGLASAKPVLRAELGRQVRTKYLPELTFELDRVWERAERLESLLREARSASTDQPHEPAAEEG
jgi:ribosome-binding factor A